MSLTCPASSTRRKRHGRDKGATGWGISRWVAGLSGVVTAAWILYRFPPEEYAFYPRCPIREYLHMECPGCGATRAISALLHGHLGAALHFNAFAVLVLLPMVGAYATLCLSRLLQNDGFDWPRIPRAATISLIVLAGVFTLLRNS